MQFLLLLTALFAGVTGVFSGSRAVEPREVGQAFAAASAIARIVPHAARRGAETRFFATATLLVPVAVRAPTPASPALLPARHPVDERRRL